MTPQEQYIRELLREQRESCVTAFFGASKKHSIGGISYRQEILNAPEPSIDPSKLSGGMQWVNVEDDLPDYDIPVLWLNESGNMVVCDLDKDGNPWLPKMTHWMPLPPPPTDQPPTIRK